MLLDKIKEYWMSKEQQWENDYFRYKEQSKKLASILDAIENRRINGNKKYYEADKRYKTLATKWILRNIFNWWGVKCSV